MPFSCFIGTFIHTKELGKLLTEEDTCMVVDDSTGKICDVQPLSKRDQLLRQYDVPEGSIVHAGYKFAGTATHLPLMQWLDAYTFPTEAGLQHGGAARDVYAKCVRRVMAHGTTTAVMFGTLHLEPCKVLADVCAAKGLRAFIGKVCMDRNSPDDYCESAAESVAGTEAFIKYLEDKGCDRLYPVVTPRFVPTCSEAALAGLAAVAAAHGAHITSHVAETADEVAAVAELHPELRRDAAVFDKHGLLGPKTVLAHGIHLTDDELALLARRGAGIAHCPLANCLVNGDGALRVRHCLSAGVAVGLGTDIAGGYSPSLLTAIRTAVVKSKLLGNLLAELHAAHLTGAAGRCAAGDTFAQQAPDVLGGAGAVLDFRDGFWLATMGGARCLDMQDELGSFEVGKYFDAALVDVGGGAVFDVFDSDGLEDRFQKFINLGDDRNIAALFVGGRRCCLDA